jgi:hypothetical protein
LFSRTEKGIAQIYETTTVGGVITPLHLDAGSDWALSPDGERIAFVRRSKNGETAFNQVTT